MALNPAIDSVTNVGAGVAVASPVLLPWIEKVSDTAALWLPVLGAVWLIVQIINKLTNWWGK